LKTASVGIAEELSELTAEKAKEFDQAIPLTNLHELELADALSLKIFRRDITDQDAEFAKAQMQKHESDASALSAHPEPD